MTPRSLHLRLLAAGAVALALALGAAGLALSHLFERHLDRRLADEATVDLGTLAAGMSLSADGVLAVAGPADPRFETMLSGLYWQVSIDGRPVARSRSLWDETLALPADQLDEAGVHVHALAGPRAARLIGAERKVRLAAPGGERAYRVVVALDRAEVAAARRAFGRDLALALGLLGLAIAAAFAIQIRVGLRPLARIRAGLAGIRSGAAPRLDLDLPAEVRPLAAEINQLLDERDAEVLRARGRAADLAHGLKTPLAALDAHARRLEEAGVDAIAGDIRALSERMRRHVGRELARARIAGRPMTAQRVPVRPVAEAVAGAVARTRQAEGKSFDFDIEPALDLAIDTADLEEILGNLMENAGRHGLSLIRVAAARTAAGIRLEIEDDGPGLGPDPAAYPIRRGGRLDEAPEGTGLGLAIVRDITDAYGGRLELAASALGGLCVRVTLPG